MAITFVTGASYHFIGLGGIGMSGLAELLVRRGCKVSGSDLAAGPITRRLEGLGVVFHQGHQAENLGEAEVVVHSTAIREDNPELAAARLNGRQVWRRGEMLAHLMEGHFQVAVTGAHGKTSTTAMVAAILRAGGLDPTVVVGALWDNLGSNAVQGRGEYFVAEADESDGSFLFLKPQITVLTNLDREHLDFYGDLSHILETFRGYLEKLPAGSRLVACGDDPHLRSLLQDVSLPCLTYSLEALADFRAGEIEPQGLGCRFRLSVGGQDQGWITLPLTGRHYVLNAMAACAVAHTLGLEADVWRAGLASLGQIHRRCQVKGETQGVLVLDDYGHHPTEIRTTLAALAQAFPQRRLVVAFQPHRYSRTRALLEDFFPAFEQAGLVFVTEIYAAGEPPVPGLSARAVCDGIRRCGHPAVHFVEDKATCAYRLMDSLRSGDVVLTLGAGDIWKTGEELLVRLAGRTPAA